MTAPDTLTEPLPAQDHIWLVLLADLDYPDDQVAVLPSGRAMTVGHMRQWLTTHRPNPSNRG